MLARWNCRQLSYLRAQFRSHGLTLLGVQEARSERDCTSSEDVFLRLSSGALRGHYGLELWVNLRQPFAWRGRKALCFCRRDFCVLHADPRMLFVRVCNPHFGGLLVVDHAPQSGRPRSERQQWWDAFTQKLHCLRRDPNERFFLMIDANASTG